MVTVLLLWKMFIQKSTCQMHKPHNKDKLNYTEVFIHSSSVITYWCQSLGEKQEKSAQMIIHAYFPRFNNMRQYLRNINYIYIIYTTVQWWVWSWLARTCDYTAHGSDARFSYNIPQVYVSAHFLTCYCFCSNSSYTGTCLADMPLKLRLRISPQ